MNLNRVQGQSQQSGTNTNTTSGKGGQVNALLGIIEVLQAQSSGLSSEQQKTIEELKGRVKELTDKQDFLESELLAEKKKSAELKKKQDDQEKARFQQEQARLEAARKENEEKRKQLEKEKLKKSRISTLRPVKISSLSGINPSSTVLEARIAASKYLKEDLEEVFLAFAFGSEPNAAKDHIPLKDYGKGYGPLFFYHYVRVEETSIYNPVPGLPVPKVFKREDMRVSVDDIHISPSICDESYQYTDFLKCQHPRASAFVNYHPNSHAQESWVGRHSFGQFDIIIRAKYGEYEYTPFSIEKVLIGDTIPECAKFGPSVYFSLYSMYGVKL